MLPPQCWSSCSPSSQGCSASWTTSTSATPPWRRRWLWPPSCRACSPSQVSHQHSAWSSSRTFSNSSGPAGRRKPKPHSMAFDTLHGLANVLTPLGPSPPQPWLCSSYSSVLNPLPTHAQCTCHTYSHTQRMPHSCTQHILTCNSRA